MLSQIKASAKCIDVISTTLGLFKALMSPVHYAAHSHLLLSPDSYMCQITGHVGLFDQRTETFSSTLKHWPPETFIQPCVYPSPLNLSSESLSLSLLSSTNRKRGLFNVKRPTDKHVKKKLGHMFLPLSDAVSILESESFFSLFLPRFVQQIEFILWTT